MKKEAAKTGAAGYNEKRIIKVVDRDSVYFGRIGYIQSQDGVRYRLAFPNAGRNGGTITPNVLFERDQFIPYTIHALGMTVSHYK